MPCRSMQVVRKQNVPIYSSVVVSEFYVNTNIQHLKTEKEFVMMHWHENVI
jgi:hypothetical protein